MSNEKETAHDTTDDSDDGWAAQYQEYLDEQEPENENKRERNDDLGANNDDIEDPEDEDWAVQYAKHCEEKERKIFESMNIKEG